MYIGYLKKHHALEKATSVEVALIEAKTIWAIVSNA
jgi:hypothetical protein